MRSFDSDTRGPAPRGLPGLVPVAWTITKLARWKARVPRSVT